MNANEKPPPRADGEHAKMETNEACQDVRQDLVALIDDQLEPARRSQLEAHLEGCQGCQAELSGLRRALEAVDALPALEPSSDLQARFDARLERERSGWWAELTTWMRRPVPILALSSSLAALVLVAALVLRPGPAAPDQDELAIANHLELFADYEAIEQLDLLEDLDVLEALGDEV